MARGRERARELQLYNSSFFLVLSRLPLRLYMICWRRIRNIHVFAQVIMDHIPRLLIALEEIIGSSKGIRPQCQDFTQSVCHPRYLWRLESQIVPVRISRDRVNDSMDWSRGVLGKREQTV